MGTHSNIFLGRMVFHYAILDMSGNRSRFIGTSFSVDNAMADNISSNQYAELLEEFRRLKQRLDTLHLMCREEIVNEEISDSLFSVLVCRTDFETVGILLRYVDEVLAMCAVAPVPDAPSWLTGLLNLGGEMIPVVDLSARIDNAPHTATSSDFIVVCTAERKRVGLIVNEVVDVYSKTREDLQLVSEHMIASPFLLGVADLDGQPLPLLRMSGLFAHTEFSEEPGDHD